MGKVAYKDIKFKDASLQQLRLCNQIIVQYQTQGFRLTLRQLYYQLVSRDLLSNTERSYKNLGKLLSDGRMAGVVDWDAIEDRLRIPHKISEWQSPADIMDGVMASYRLPRWDNQPHRVELWCEKDALAGVLRPIADQYHVTMMVNRGYSSTSAMKEAADRMVAAGDNGKNRVILYIGDLDPSGEDMVRDIEDRLFLMADMYGPSVIKLAITEAQVALYNPPPNPAKMSDSRAARFVDKFGQASYEADALPPDVLAQIVRDSLDTYVDQDAWDSVSEREEKDKELLRWGREQIMKRRNGDDDIQEET